MFADFIHKHFKEVFEKSNNPKDKLFLQDGDPLQNSRKANNAIYKVGAKKLSIPARSPDMNPIENVCNFGRTELLEEPLNRNRTVENFEEYSGQIVNILSQIIFLSPASSLRILIRAELSNLCRLNLDYHYECRKLLAEYTL